jgi:hypothetical protein
MHKIFLPDDNIKTDAEQDMMVWTGFIWLRIESSSGLM